MLCNKKKTKQNIDNIIQLASRNREKFMFKIKKDIHNYNYIYMFKNPIRFFIDINDFKPIISTFDNLTLNFLSSTQPATFNIRKYYGETDYRQIHFPNIINFYVLLNELQKNTSFPVILKSTNSRMAAVIDTGDFSSEYYKYCIEKDMLNLVKYDFLLKMDIKSFYDSIYTHTLSDTIKIGLDEKFVTNQNKSISAGLIKGPYTSLFLAEKFLAHIVAEYDEILRGNKIKFHLEFFSDDIYVFTDKESLNEVKHHLTRVLSKYDLETNSQKHKTYDYLTYSKENIIDKYWNIIIRDQNNYELISDPPYYLNFINQLIYRKDKLNNKRLESIFMNGFFKSKFFVDLDTTKYEIHTSDLHKILFIYREHPETILYSINKFIQFENFIRKARTNIYEMFIRSLDNPFHEEQIYYFYALLKMGFNKEFDNIILRTKVLQTNNCVLISYFVTMGIYDYELEALLSKKAKDWIINYHLILRMYRLKEDNYLNLIETFLVPTPHSKNKQGKKETYLKFYSMAIESDISFVNMEITNAIESYLSIKKKQE